MPGLHMIALLVLFSLALGSFAEGSERQGRSASSVFARRRARNLSRGGNVARASSKTYTLQDMYKGESFLNEWEYMVGDDPTHGSVQYQSRDDAIKKQLAYIQEDGTTVLAVDDTTPLPRGAPRDSVRISTKKKYNGGLFIADFFAMPHGCSVWPAYWSVGPNWPNAGEIDIVEGIHDQPTNQYTLHSGPNCNLTTGNTQVTGRVGNRQCATINGVNTGCYFADEDTRSYGQGFNLIAGGVFAHLWDQDGLKIWHFPRTDIPVDITEGNPDPSSWPAPVGYWAATECNMAEHFYEHSLVIDTTLCGDWAGGSSYKSAGCPGTDCKEAVMDPTNYIFAKWKINYIAVYQ